MGRKLHRSVSDKKPFGVCGGLSEYFNIDSNFFRIIFVMLTLYATIGVWIYLALALFMTPDDGYTSPEYHSKEKLVRVVEDKKLFGVCAGYAQYFDIDVISLRIIVALATLIGFGPIFYLVSMAFMPIGEKTVDETGEITFEQSINNNISEKTEEKIDTPTEQSASEENAAQPKKRVCARRVRRRSRRKGAPEKN